MFWSPLNSKNQGVSQRFVQDVCMNACRCIQCLIINTKRKIELWTRCNKVAQVCLTSSL